MRVRLLPALAALVLGAATAVLVACGGDGRIPAGDASSLKNALNQVSADYRAGQCTAAAQAVAKAQNELLNLPDSVNAKLRNRLQSGISNLRKRVSATCEQTQTQTQTTQPATTTTDTTTTATTTTDTGTTGSGTGTTDTGTTATGTTGTGTTGTGTTTAPTDTGTGGTSVGGTTP
ncbi:MAG: hypothetical protein ACXWZZ_06575 [Solirubrobacteraceae bacterium]